MRPAAYQGSKGLQQKKDGGPSGSVISGMSGESRGSTNHFDWLMND